MSNWFVFFVQTGSEQIACEFLNKMFCKEESIAFIPQVKLIYKNSSSMRKEFKPMFPGYVFVDSILDERTFIFKTNKFIHLTKYIFNLLGSRNIDCMKLNDDEMKFLLHFCDDEYVTEESKGFIIGDEIFVTSGPLKGKESVIKKIDRHKRQAEIEMIFLGDRRRICVSLEIVTKVLCN